MRRWMNVLAVTGVVGVTLSVGLASERLIEGRTTPSSKTAASKSAAPKAKRPDRLEYYGRTNQSASGLNSPEAAAAVADPELDALAAEATATPTRYARKKLAPVAPSLMTTKKPTAIESIAEVEFVQPPQDDDAVLATTGDSEADESGETLPVSFQTISGEKSKAVASKKSEQDSGVIDAGFAEIAGVKPQIQKVTAEKPQFKKVPGDKVPAKLVPPTKGTRTATVVDRTPKSPSAPAVRTAATAARGDTTRTASTTAGSPAVNVEWGKRGEIIVGQECECELLVKNSGQIAARQVLVEAFFPASVRLVGADPEPKDATDHLEWTFSELPAGAERTIRITMIPSLRGDLAATANVRFTETTASVFKVQEPLLKVSISAPTDVVIGDPLVQGITITNPGTGVAQNVKLNIVTPEGLEHSRGDRSSVDVGAVNPGESRVIRLSFTATAGGEQTVIAEVTGDSGLKQVAESTVNVIAPELKVAVEGSELQHVGREAQFTLSVTNEGTAAAENVRVSHRLPKGFEFVKADKGGSFDSAQGAVVWSIGHMKPNQSTQLKLQLQARQEGEFELQVLASAEHGLTAKASTTTNVEGSAELALEIQDLEDPIAVGQEAAYEVRVSNKGSKSADNIGLTFELPSGLELINVQAATQHLSKKGLILFDDLPTLPPGKTALYRIHVRSRAEGSQRVRARLTSDSIDQELIREELTKVHGE